MVAPIDDRLEGKYEVLEKLGEGGMGAVYKARHRLLNEIRVIKVMRSGLKGDSELEERFLREARVASRLRHPNVAQLFDFTIDEDGNAYIVMEFIDGLTLEEILKRKGPMEFGLALEVALQSLRAIEYLHRMSFVHRDIAPDNLMLSQDVDDRPLVKLIDLGIAKSLAGERGLTATGMFLGKFRYSSPEQLSASTEQQIDGRADLYSFGVVLYEILTGRSPIEGDEPPAIIGGHLFRPPVPFEESDPAGRVPPELRSIILDALAKEPDERIPDAIEFSRRLSELHSRDSIAGQVGTDLDLLPTVKDRSSRVGKSTQEQLNRQFGLDPTKLTEPTLSPRRTVVVGQQPTELVAERPTAIAERLTVKTPPPQTQPTLARAPLPSSRHRAGKLWLRVGVPIAALLAMALSLAYVGGLFRGRDGDSGAQPIVAAGTLVLDAIPWGEVAQVVDAEGRRTNLPPDVETPLVLELSPGSYVVTISNSELGITSNVSAEIQAGETERRVVELEAVDAKAYFEGVGW